jgi:hypothetical protein
MAKKPRVDQKLTFVEIVMRADADVIKAAYEARVKVDELLAEREAAYRRIFELENEVETLIGEEGVFVFPPPPAPVAGLEKLTALPRKPQTAGSRGGAKSAAAQARSKTTANSESDAAKPASGTQDAAKQPAAQPDAENADQTPEKPSERAGSQAAGSEA